MSFDWKEYLKLALELSGNKDHKSNRDAKMRSAISRAYYACYCSARDYLIEVDHNPNAKNLGQQMDSHRYVIDEFKHHIKEELRPVGGHLEILFTYRKKADYSSIFADIEVKVDQSIAKAIEILKMLDENR